MRTAVTGPVLLSTEHDAWNPTGKVPTLVLQGERALFGSQAIVAYLDSIAAGGRRLMPEGTHKFDEMTLESLADGLLDAALLIRYEISTRVSETMLDGFATVVKYSI